MTVFEEMVGLPEAEHGVYDDKKAFCVRACSRPMMRREAGSSLRWPGIGDAPAAEEKTTRRPTASELVQDRC